MITRTYNVSGRTLIATAVSAVLMAACATEPQAPAGAAQARSKLTQLQSDQQLATRAPVAIKDADTAVRVAETPQTDAALAAHQVYIADRKVDTAIALAEARLAEDQRAALGAERESARLDSRTQEADAAKAAVASAVAESAELRRQIDELQAMDTDRGLVLTLGDVLFETGRADLKSDATTNLTKLVAFLNNYPTRTVLIEGYTDNVGSEDYNQGLSRRRAETVQSYLVRQGVDPARLSASGLGEGSPVADNESAAGRQQNRRVEVIISNPALASR